MENPKNIIRIFDSLVYEQWLQAVSRFKNKKQSHLAEDVQELWETYIRVSGKPKLNLLSQDKFLSAYMHGFHLNNAWRFLNLLDRSGPSFFDQIKGHKLRIWDLGGGTGAASQASYHYLSECGTAEIESVTLVDSTKKATAIGKSLLADQVKTYSVNCNLSEFKMRKTDDDQVDVFLFSYVFNEMLDNPVALKKMLQQFRAKIQNQEKFIIMITDSAHQSHNKNLLKLRDRLVDMELTIGFPCPSSESCPALLRPNDRCFMNGQRALPPTLTRQLKVIERDTEKFDYVGFVFLSPALSPAKSKKPWVVIGEPERQNFLICKGHSITKKHLKLNRYLRGMFIPNQ